MGNSSNLRPKPFTSENQPPGHKKSRKGIPNRATVFKKWLDTKIKIDSPTVPNTKLTVTLMEAAALGQIESAMKGNTNAWKEIQDSLHGKQTEKVEQTGSMEHKHTVDLSKLSMADLKKLKELNQKLND